MSNVPERRLHIIRRTCVADIRSDEPDLNLRQLVVLLVVYLTNEPQTARGLAANLNVNKSAIIGVLDRLEELELAFRTIDDRDRRSVVVQRTAGGTIRMERLAAMMAALTEKAEQTLANGLVCA